MSQRYEDIQSSDHYAYNQDNQISLQQPQSYQIFKHSNDQLYQSKMQNYYPNDNTNQQILLNDQENQTNQNSIVIDLQKYKVNSPILLVQDLRQQEINQIDNEAQIQSEEQKGSVQLIQDNNTVYQINENQETNSNGKNTQDNTYQKKQGVIVIDDISENIQTIQDCNLENSNNKLYIKEIIKKESQNQQFSQEFECDSENISAKSQKSEQQRQLALRTKKVRKNKVEKAKQVDYNIIQTKKQLIAKEKRRGKGYQQDAPFDLQIIMPVIPKYQFFLFCDIVIQYENIVGKKIVQSKRSQLNLYKKISYVKEYKISNLYEVGLQHTCQTQMEFQAASQYLLSLNDQYAKQVHDSLQILQEKTRIGLETALMIQNNRASFELIMKRKEYSKMKYEEFKIKTLPNYKYYIFNHYVFDIYTGNIGFVDNGISKDFLKILCIEPQYFEVMMKKYGIIDFLKRDYVTAFSISYFNRFAYNMRNFNQTVRFSSDFITLDNIEIKVDIEHQIIDLCKEFDQENNFDCPFIDFVAFLTPQITDDIIENIQKVREEQQIDIDELLEMGEEEIDFFYSLESQQFLKRYYQDIFNREILTHNLKNQKLDYTLPHKKNQQQ